MSNFQFLQCSILASARNYLPNTICTLFHCLRDCKTWHFDVVIFSLTLCFREAKSTVLQDCCHFNFIFSKNYLDTICLWLFSFGRGLCSTLPATHTCVNCRSTQTICPPHIYLDVRSTHSAHWARCLGTLFPRSLVIQPSPLTSSDKSFQQFFWMTVSFDTYMYSVFWRSITTCTFVTVSVKSV